MLKAKEPRDQVLFVRIKSINKAFIQKTAKSLNMEEAPFLDAIIDEMRESYKEEMSKAKREPGKQK